MRNIQLYIYILLFCAFFLYSDSVHINAEELPDSIFIPRISSAVSDDALATTLNPAGLGVRKGINGYYLHTFSGKTGGDDAFFLSYSGSGFGAEFVKPGAVKFNKYTLSDGIKILNGLYFGLSYAWFNSKDKNYDDLSSWDIGTIYRPSQYISTSFVARNLNRPVFGNTHTDRTYSLSFAFRPYTNRITFSVDSHFQEGKEIEDARLTYGLECEPIDGIIFKGSYNSKKNYGVGFSLGFPQFRVGTYNSLNKHWKNEGGVFYTQFAEERYRATLRAKHQVLEVDANDLSNWKMQELILNRAKKDKAIDGIILKLNSTP
ncbi:hypothetical protein FJZ33_10860, partial [Candidatus Poribacteria bacterium]|nr:hypothetical protein [Candidatus Poribacteria bacterium]